jgi:hypothetical protein
VQNVKEQFWASLMTGTLEPETNLPKVIEKFKQAGKKTGRNLHPPDLASISQPKGLFAVLCLPGIKLGYFLITDWEGIPMAAFFRNVIRNKVMLFMVLPGAIW